MRYQLTARELAEKAHLREQRRRAALVVLAECGRPIAACSTVPGRSIRELVSLATDGLAERCGPDRLGDPMFRITGAGLEALERLERAA